MAKVYAEVEFEVTGTHEPGDPSVGMEPSVRELEVTHISILNYDHRAKTHVSSPLLNVVGGPLLVSDDVSRAIIDQLEEEIIEALWHEAEGEEPYNYD